MKPADTFETFVARIPGLEALGRTELARFFVYFLTIESTESVATPAAVAACFRQAELEPYDDVRFYLNSASKAVRGKKALVVKAAGGYRLERTERERMRRSLSAEPHRREAEATLRSLIGSLSTEKERDYLDEAVKCYEVGAYRAAMLLTWLLTMDHLMEFILTHHTASFNVELAKVKDKRVKVSSLGAKDDFGDIPEGKFIEIARAAHIISNDVRKILDQKLSTRNTYAHPSNVELPPVKVAEFITDLVSNVLLKYSI